MADVFISYARSTSAQARAAADALRAAGFTVWMDDDLAAHRTFTHEIDSQLTAARATLVIWSADAAASDWVLSEANRAREARKLVQLRLDKARLPMPFDQIHCADLEGWSGAADHAGWLKVVASIGELTDRPDTPSRAAAVAPPAAPQPAGKPSIAVTPFANLSGDPEQQYFADGMVEEIIAALCRCRSIFVIGSGSTFSFRGANASPQEVGRQLGVRYVLEGSVRKAGSRVRIAVKLTDATDGGQIWADRIDGTLEDVFALQDNVALAVAGVIEPAVRDAEIRRAASSRPTENMGSYDLYLRAQAHGAGSPGLDQMPHTLELLERAIALDPNNAPALAQAAMINAVLSLRAEAREQGTHRARCVDLMQQALQAAGDDPAVLSAVAGAGIVIGRDTASLLPMVERALALNPGSAEAWAHSGRLRIALGEPDLAAEHLEMAMRLDPKSRSRFNDLADLGCARLLQRRFAEAIPLIAQSIDLWPTFAPAHAWMASALGHAGRTVEARASLARFDEMGVGTIESFAERRFRTTDGRELFLEGIAAARA